MTFTSAAPDITEAIPLALSGRISENIALYARSGAAFDVAIGGLPFFLAIDANTPYQRQTAQWRKDQFDTSKEPGEQTLSSWWTRSQASFHKGEGINFYEPSTDELTVDRYDHAVGVDVWTLGQLSLIRSMAQQSTAGSDHVWVESATIAGTSGFYAVYDGAVHYTIDGSSEVTVTGGTAVSRIALCGSSVVVGTGDGTLLKGSIGGSAVAAFSSGLPGAVGVTATPYWIKSRVIVTVGPAVYEVPLAGGAGLTPLFTHPDAAWEWTYVAETPQAILAAGRSPSGRSGIFRFGLTTPSDGSTPQIAQPSQVAEFPPGEEVHAIRVYLGTYVGIGTTHGLRVGLVADDGGLQYGPLLMHTDEPVTCITGFDEYLVAGVTRAIDGKSGSVRVNLAEPVENLRFAWSWDTQIHDVGTVNSIAFVATARDGTQQTDVVLGVGGQGVWRQGATVEATGYLLTGKVRYATTELKLFRLLDVDCDTNAGTIALSTLDDGGAESSVFTLADETGAVSGVNVNSLPSPQKYAQVKFTLRPNDDATATPVMRSWTLKSLPVVRRQRLIRYPLELADFHVDTNGIKVGAKGAGYVAMSALEEAESARAILLVQDFRTGETFPATVESVDVSVPESPARHDPAFRGVLSVVMRKL